MAVKGKVRSVVDLLGLFADAASFNLISSLRDVISSVGMHSFTTITVGTYTVQPTDWLMRADCTGGIVIAQLPEASTVLGQEFALKKLDVSANHARFSTTGGQTIDGAATLDVATQYSSTRVIAVGAPGNAGWDVVP